MMSALAKATLRAVGIRLWFERYLWNTDVTYKLIKWRKDVKEDVGSEWCHWYRKEFQEGTDIWAINTLLGVVYFKVKKKKGKNV